MSGEPNKKYFKIVSFSLLALAFVLAGEQTRALVRSHVVGADVDPRVRADFTNHPELASVGLLTNDAGDEGSAFLIDSCYVLTARHVAFHDSNHPSKSSRSVFHVGLTKGRYWWRYSDEVGATPVVWGQDIYTPGEIEADDWLYGVGEDFALLRLDRCLEAYLPIELFSEPFDDASKQKKMSLSRATFGDPTKILWDIGGKILRDLGDRWSTDLATQVGDSGGPIFEIPAHGSDARYRAIAILSIDDIQNNGEKFDFTIPATDAQRFNYAAPVAGFFDRVQSAMREDSKNRPSAAE